MKRPTFMKLRSCFVLLFASFAFGTAPAQESTEDLVKRLRGSAGEEEKKGGAESGKMQGISTRGLTTRGLKTRSLSAPQEPKKETRSVYFSTRGIPKAVQVAAEEDNVKLEKTKAKESSGAGDHAVAAGEEAVELKYDVDPKSKVTRDNILFRKGTADFANEASFNVVSELATALKDPSLAKLKYVIEGHASSEGSASANQALSQRRAERIVTVLGSLGVSGDRLLPVGFGETQARFPAHSEEFLLKQDRRVLIFRLDK